MFKIVVVVCGEEEEFALFHCFPVVWCLFSKAAGFVELRKLAENKLIALINGDDCENLALHADSTAAAADSDRGSGQAFEK